MSADVDDGIENYDYENVNDRENYCPNPDDVSRLVFCEINLYVNI